MGIISVLIGSIFTEPVLIVTRLARSLAGPLRSARVGALIWRPSVMTRSPPPGFVPVIGDIIEDGRVVPRRPIPPPPPKGPMSPPSPKG